MLRILTEIDKLRETSYHVFNDLDAFISQIAHYAHKEDILEVKSTLIQASLKLERFEHISKCLFRIANEMRASLYQRPLTQTPLPVKPYPAISGVQNTDSVSSKAKTDV